LSFLPPRKTSGKGIPQILDSISTDNVRINKYTNSKSNPRIIIPTLNEEENLRYIIRKLKTYGFNDILIIDGNSTDQTTTIAKNLGVKIILQKGRGKGNAVRQVLNEESKNKEILVFMDADGSMDPEEIPLFIKALDSGADLVKGSRFLSHAQSTDLNPMRTIGNLLLNIVVNLLHSTDYSDVTYGFVAYDKKAIKLMSRVLKSNNFEIETEIFIKAKKLGLKVVEIPSTELKRKNGESKLNSFSDGFKILKMIIKEFFSGNSFSFQ